MKRTRLTADEYTRLLAGETALLDAFLDADGRAPAPVRQWLSPVPTTLEDPQGASLMVRLWAEPGEGAVRAIARLQAAGVPFDEHTKFGAQGVHALARAWPAWDPVEAEVRLRRWQAEGGSLSASMYTDTPLSLIAVHAPTAIDTWLALGSDPAVHVGQGQHGQSLAIFLAKGGHWAALRRLEAHPGAWKAAQWDEGGSALLRTMIQTGAEHHRTGQSTPAQLSELIQWVDDRVTAGANPWAPSVSAPAWVARTLLVPTLLAQGPHPDTVAQWQAAWQPILTKWLDAALPQAARFPLGVWVAHEMGDADRVLQWALALAPAEQLVAQQWPRGAWNLRPAQQTTTPPHTGLLAALLLESPDLKTADRGWLESVVQGCEADPVQALGLARAHHQRQAILAQAQHRHEHPRPRPGRRG
jgi:hypothetical protein